MAGMRIIDEMKLTQHYVDGRYFDKKNDLVAFDPSIFDENFLNKVLLIRRDKLFSFLKNKNYSIIWALLGEKNMIGGGGIGQPLGWLAIDGAYSINGSYQIVGAKRSCFKKSKN